VVDRWKALFYVCSEIYPSMKTVRFPVLFTALFFCFQYLQAQITSPSETALVFADSFLKSFRNNDLEQYTNLSYPGVVTYYGGNKNFREYVSRARTINNSPASQNLTVIQLVRDIGEWQCVIQKTAETTIDGRKAQIVSYMIGQSQDDGETWKFVDISFNAPGNLAYIMPDISAKLAIPQRQVIFEEAGASVNM
jgi:hypothetical protein